MKQERSDLRFEQRLTAAVGAFSLALLSCFAAADVSGLDAGELGGAAFMLGVPHPNGFPLDMLLLRASALWPFGSLAYRQNLCVSMITAAAVSCVAYACLRLALQCGWSSKPALVACASVSAASLLCSRTLLDAALSVEVYATSLLCVALSAVMVDDERSCVRRAVWPLAGLSLGAHITAPLLIAPLLLVAAARERRARVLFGLIASSVSVALILSYVPLASLRDTAFDWGDPETLGRWLRHLSAARIREAYADSLFARESLPRLRLLEQLSEQPQWLLLAAAGALAVAARQRQRALVVGVLLSFDLAYAAWINPMGIAQRQVGHTSFALIAAFAGCGSAFLIERLRAAPLRLAWALAAVSACSALGLAGRAVSQASWRDGYAVSERFGSGSPLSDLPPHSVFVCASDNGCASALFSLYAEGTRPDIDVVPAQHLWEPTVLRRLHGLPLAAAADARAWPAPEQRAERAATHLRALIAQRQLRPLYLEHVPETYATAGVVLDHVPLIGLGRGGAPARQDTGPDLDALEHARFGQAGPSSPLERELWASAHDTLGEVYLRQGRDDLAVAQYARAVSLTPLRAAAVGNLGVALEQRGDLDGALKNTAHAVELDPSRPTPWVNLARLLWRVHGPEAARAALIDASRFAVRDPRLDEITRRLQASDAAGSQGTTR